MDRERLLELAGLDALGLLEPEEQREFNIGLAKADAHLRQAIRDVQDSVLELDRLLPRAEPDAALRTKLIDAVSRVIALEAQTSLAHEPVGRITQWTRQDYQRTTATRGVWSGWRIVALILFTVSAGLTWLAYDYRATWQDMRDMWVNGHIRQLVEGELGRPVTDFVFRSDVTHIALRPADTAPDDFHGHIAVFYLNDDQRGILVWQDLPDTRRTYQLLAGPSNAASVDKLTVLHTFTAGGPAGGSEFDAGPDFDPAATNGTTRWLVQVISETGERQTVLTS